MRGFISAAIVTICTNVTAQPYDIGHTTAMMRDTQRGNREIRVEIYYPVRIENTGSDKDDGCAGKFPVICFAHGYVMSPDSYGYILEALVPEGYIVVFPYSETGMFPSHLDLSKDLAFVLEETAKLGLEAGSPLYGITGDSSCLMGHSMGGGALFAAANLYEGTLAVVALAPMNSKPSAIQAAASVTVPTLIFAGEGDCITPPGRYQMPIYNFSAAADKTYILIRGGTHCGMADSSRICTLAEKISGCNKGLSPSGQHQILKKYLIPWLNFFLKWENDQGIIFDAELRSDTAVTWLQSRPLVSTSPAPL
jgi:predicted dienelactone hydrolase